MSERLYAARGTQAEPFSDENYDRFNQLVENRFGLYFPEKRRVELERGVLQAFAASTCSSLEAFYQLLLDNGNNAVHLERLVNALTICESHFFRDAAQFSALEKNVLPQLIERRRSLRTLRIWSAGCASGEEAYSIAILLRQLLPDIDEWSITILATDINSQALDRAHRAVYSEWAFREEQAHRLRPIYFRKEGNTYALSPEIRRMVTFTRLNLMQDDYPSYANNTTFMDLIICRNVTIYFPAAVTQNVADRFFEALSDGGWLVVGHSEPSIQTYNRYQARNFPGAILYQRTAPIDPAQPFNAVKSDLDLGSLTVKPVNPPVFTAEVKNEKPLPTTWFDPPPARVEETISDPLAQAREHLSMGQSEQARDLLLDFCRKQPRQAAAIALLGQVYANLGDWAKAEEYCRQAIQLDRLARDPYYILALVLQHQGLLDQATETMKKVVYLNRKDILGHFGLADLYHSRGQRPQAIKALDNAFHLLEGCQDNDMIPDSGGITVGRLRGVIVNQQQRWSAELA